MEIGNFLGKLKGEDKKPPQQFLALVLTDEVVQAAVWNVVAGQTNIVSQGAPVEWDGDTATTNELVTAVDATISSATDGLDQEPSSVILGIPLGWSDKNGVLGVKRSLINQIRKDLDLTALGYVTITDSILSYLKLQEGTPSTSILIHVSRDEFVICLVRLGRVEAVETIGRSDDEVADITEALTRFKNLDNLPSRIILFNSMHGLDDIIQNLLSVDWQKDFNFLHIPKIESLPKDVTICALVTAGGAEIAKSLGFSVTETSPTTPDLTGPEDPDPDLLSPEEIGFTDSSSEKVDFIDPDDEPEFVPESEPPAPSVIKPRFVIPKFTLPKLTYPKLKLDFSRVKRHWWVLGSILVALVLLAFYLIWFLPSATLDIHVSPKTLDENVELTLSTTATDVDFNARIVPATTEEVEESGEKTVTTTGKKIVGEVAKGEVTLYNRTTSVKNFTKGTTLALGKLKFTLDSDVLVASKSAGSDYVDVPGKANVGVSAVAIGAESNLPSGSELHVASFSKDSYVAKNESELSGGTSEEIQVVGKDDQKSLVKELTTQIMDNFTTQAEDTYLIPSSLKIKSEDYSAKVGDKATALTLKLSLSGTLLRYQTSDVTNLVNSAIDASVPPGYVRANLPSSVELTATTTGDNSDSVEGNAKVSVTLLPVLDLLSLKKALSGKNTQVVEEVLSSSVPGYLDFNLELLPRFLPPRLRVMPYNTRAININLSPAL